jgi:hypothetical protein
MPNTTTIPANVAEVIAEVGLNAETFNSEAPLGQIVLGIAEDIAKFRAEADAQLDRLVLAIGNLRGNKHGATLAHSSSVAAHDAAVNAASALLTSLRTAVMHYAMTHGFGH